MIWSWSQQLIMLHIARAILCHAISQQSTEHTLFQTMTDLYDRIITVTLPIAVRLFERFQLLQRNYNSLSDILIKL
jgi:hypothetical protein